MKRRSRLRRVFVWIGTALCALTFLAMAACLRWTFVELKGDDYTVALTGGVVHAIWAEKSFRLHMPTTVRTRLPIQSFAHIAAVWSQYPALPSKSSAWGVGTLIVPLWIPLAVFAVPTAWLWWQDPRRHAPGTCCCGYDLTGNTSGRCPECGEEVAHARRSCRCGCDITDNSSGRCPQCGHIELKPPDWIRACFAFVIVFTGVMWLLRHVEGDLKLLLAAVMAGFSARWLLHTANRNRLARIMREEEERRARNVCPRCEYDLTGNASGRCPECGQALRPSL